LVKGIKAIFFDIGGTLVMKSKYPSRDLTKITRIAEIINEKCSPVELEERIVAGESRYKAWRSHTLTELSPEERWPRFLLSDLPQELVSRHAEELQTLWSDSRGMRIVSPETVTTLLELNKRGYVLGTISHTSPKYLESAGLLPLFKTIIHASRFGIRKPHPAPFLAAAREVGIPPQECAYVGDRPSRDVIGAREAGFGMVIQLVLTTTTPEGNPCPMQPDLILQTLEDLLDVFPLLKTGPTELHTFQDEPPLYDAALSTMWWNRSTVSAEQFFSQGRGLGFSRFELNHQIPPEILAKINLDLYHIGSLHDPCPAVISAKTLERTDQVISSLNNELRQWAVDGVKRTIDAAYQLCARHVVIHPGRIVGEHTLDDELRDLYSAGLKGTPQYEDQRKKVMADRAARATPHLAALITSLREIIEFADGKGLTLGLENRYHYHEIPIFDEMDILLNEFQQPWVGWHLDVGHLQVLGEMGLTPLDSWLIQFGARITGVHLHDVIGIKDHQTPGTGDVDFVKIAKFLPSTAYRTLEIGSQATREDIAAGMEVLVKTGCVLII
jgi:HAD superfamily hydrolase (TIGR01549 family)